jgi:hypothetical protein
MIPQLGQRIPTPVVEWPLICYAILPESEEESDALANCPDL